MESIKREDIQLIHAKLTVMVRRTCQVTSKLHAFEVQIQDYLNWAGGKQLIQDAFPYLTQEQREILKTGFTNAEWELVFPEEEDE